MMGHLSDDKTKLINETELTTEEIEQNPWYFRLMHGGKSGAVIGAAAGTLIAPGLGTLIGTLAGAISGAIIGFIGGFAQPWIRKLFPALYELDDEITEEETDSSTTILYPQPPHKPTRPSNFFKWDFNLILGTLGGSTLGAAAISLITADPHALLIATLTGGVLGAGASTAYPHLAKLTKPVKGEQKQNQVEWFSESILDVPWYVRVTLGLMTGLTLGGLIGTAVPGIGNIIGGAAGALILGAAAGISPTAFNLMKRGYDKIKSYLGEPDKNLAEGERDDQNWPEFIKEDTYDLPWYVRGFAGVSAGAALGAALGSIVPGIGTAIGAVAGAAIVGGIAVASPGLFYAARKAVSSITSFFSDKKEKESQKLNESQKAPHNQSQMDVPWYFRAFAGATAGAAIGAAIGTIVPGIGTAIGGAIGTFLGAGVTLAWPGAYDGLSSLGSKIKSKLFSAKDTTTQENDSSKTEAPKPQPTVPWYMRAMSGAMIGGIIGAGIGSVVPGIGTAIGGAAGTLIGAGAYVLLPIAIDFVSSLISSSSSKKPEKNESRQEVVETDKNPTPLPQATNHGPYLSMVVGADDDIEQSTVGEVERSTKINIDQHLIASRDIASVAALTSSAGGSSALFKGAAGKPLGTPSATSANTFTF